MPKDRFDLLARDADVFSRCDTTNNPTSGWCFSATQWNLNARAIRKMGQRRGQCVGQSLGTSINRALDGDDDERQSFGDDVGREERHDNAAYRTVPGRCRAHCPQRRNFTAS